METRKDTNSQYKQGLFGFLLYIYICVCVCVLLKHLSESYKYQPLLCFLEHFLNRILLQQPPTKLLSLCIFEGEFRVNGYTCWTHIAACLSNKVTYLACVPEVLCGLIFLS
jgi:hypothetical protein